MLLVEAGTGVTWCNDHATVWITTNDNLILQSIETNSGTTHVPYQWVLGAVSSGVNYLGGGM
jgi:hypothetical protein